MAVLLLAEVNNGELAMDAVAKAVTAVAKLGDVHVLWAGATPAAADGRHASPASQRCSSPR
jgi:electron transfer flavoprotein alpha subunit